MDPIKTTDYQYLVSILDWYTHYRGMDSHRLALKLAKEKTAAVWSCDNVKQAEVNADYLTGNIDKLLRGAEHED